MAVRCSERVSQLRSDANGFYGTRLHMHDFLKT